MQLGGRYSSTSVSLEISRFADQLTLPSSGPEEAPQVNRRVSKPGHASGSHYQWFSVTGQALGRGTWSGVGLGEAWPG